jgi:hypothetical protein
MKGEPMGKKGFIIVFIGLCAGLVPFSGFCVSVDWVSGDVAYRHLQNDWEELDVGMDLTSGDIVKTGTSSEATLVDEGTEIFIMENSTFTVSEKYVNEKRKPGFMLFLGRMRFKLARGEKEEPEIQTQTVNLTIRGTEFEVGSGHDGSTLVVIEDGVVAVKGNTRELVLEKGEGTEVAFGEEPTEKFEVMTRVIDWDDWLKLSKESVKGNEAGLLERILTRFRGIEEEIRENEKIREEALTQKEEYLKKRDEYLAQEKQQEAAEYSKKGRSVSKTAFHAFVNIRFLALSCIGLIDLADSIYSGVEAPEKELTDTYDEIHSIYAQIEEKYVFEGDRERLEKKAEEKRGCRKLF